MPLRLPWERKRSATSQPHRGCDTAGTTGNGARGGDDVYDDGYLRVEHKNYYVACGGTALKLPRTEFLIFSRLARTPDRIVKADELWAYIWGADKPLNTESLHVYIYRLRAKLISHSLQIETMVNVGYRLITVENRSPEA